MTEHHSMAMATLAHVALRIACHGCTTGPTEFSVCDAIRA